MELNLSSVEVRVLGVLIEKQTTTPEYYPLSLNATKNACNQKSSRDPVMNLEENEVEVGFKKLLGRGLTLYRGEMGTRVSKFEHLFDSTFHLNEKQKAVMCLLMLRGAQTPGEIKSRCVRIYEFESVPQLEQTLESLVNREHQALALKLEKQPGRKENRYTHLLSGQPEILKSKPLSDPQIGFKGNNTAAGTNSQNTLEETVKILKKDLAVLRSEFENFKKQFD